MGNFVTLIRRSDFNDLYKFGHLFVHNAFPFQGEMSEQAENKSLFDAVTAYMNTYEYSTEYLILHFNRSAFQGTSVEVFIKDVVGIYALDQDAHASLSASLDPRINLQVTCWTHFFMELSMKHSVRQSKAGLFNCFKIFKITEDESRRASALIPQNFVEDLFVDLFNQERPEGNKSIWTYLLRYERHHPYWNDMRGYFSDAIHVFENFKKKHEIDYEIADEVPLGDLLMRCGTNFSEIYSAIMATNPTEYMVDGCNYFAVAGLFLYMNSLFREGGITMNKLHQNEHLINGTTHDKYKLDFALAVALLGIKLGQELTYSCYYEINNLAIFNKTLTQPSRINKELPIVDPDDGKSLSLEDAQELLNNQYEKIGQLSDKIQDLELTIHDINKERQVEQKADEQQQIIQEEPTVVDKEPQQVVQEEPTDIGNEPQQVVQEEPTEVVNEPQQAVQDEPIDIGNKPLQTYKLDEAVAEPTAEQDNNSNKEDDTLKTPTEESDNNQEKIETNILVQSLENKSDSYVEQKLSFDEEFEPVLMKKLIQDRTRFYANDNGIYAHSQEEYDNLRKKRYERADFFESKNN